MIINYIEKYGNFHFFEWTMFQVQQRSNILSNKNLTFQIGTFSKTWPVFDINMNHKNKFSDKFHKQWNDKMFTTTINCNFSSKLLPHLPIYKIGIMYLSKCKKKYNQINWSDTGRHINKLIEILLERWKWLDC